MYQKILKDSAASTKAWESRKRTAAANQKETYRLIQDAAGMSKSKTVGNTGLSPKEYKNATNALTKTMAQAGAAEQKAITAAASKSGLESHAKSLFKQSGADFEAFEGNGGILTLDNAAHSKIVANAKAGGYKYTASKDVVGDPSLASEGSETYKIPKTFSFTHPDGSTIDVSRNTDKGEFATMDVSFKKNKSSAKKTDLEHMGSLAATLGLT